MFAAQQGVDGYAAGRGELLEAAAVQLVGHEHRALFGREFVERRHQRVGESIAFVADLGSRAAGACGTVSCRVLSEPSSRSSAIAPSNSRSVRAPWRKRSMIRLRATRLSQAATWRTGSARRWAETRLQERVLYDGLDVAEIRDLAAHEGAQPRRLGDHGRRQPVIGRGRQRRGG